MKKVEFRGASRSLRSARLGRIARVREWTSSMAAILLATLLGSTAISLAAEAAAVAAPPQTERQDPFDTALAAIGLTKETFTFDYKDMSNYGGDKYALPLFYTLHSSPFKIENHVKAFRKELLDNAGTLATPVSFGSRRLNETIRRGLIANPLDSLKLRVTGSDPLCKAISQFEAFYGRPLSRTMAGRLEHQASAVPLDVQRFASIIIYTAIDSMGYHQQAFKRASKEFDLVKMRNKVQSMFASDKDIVDLEIEHFIDAIDFKYLFTPSQELAMGVDFAADSLAGRTFPAGVRFEWPTPLGKLVIGGTEDNFYPAGEYFLVIDLGGNDTYEAAATNRSLRNWISIVIDVSGNDTYKPASDSGPSTAAGVFGYAYLVDLAGNDVYKGKNLTQGVGLFGVGALVDRGGRDSYEGYMLTQGAGVFGIGSLTDLEGDDYYHCWQQGQGYGFTKGFGLLLDKSGDDRYVAEDSVVVFPGQQTKEHNTSLAQGVGFGKRADYIDGHSWGGGIGFLIDGAGNDSYSAGLFAQGCGYWYAIGLLSDVSGNDTYNAPWYVQGSGAHFALGILLDSGGNDVYTAPMNMAQGAGHDFTLGVLIDESGNDVYNAPYLSLGAGNANGMGFFWDKRGDDVYNTTATLTLGRASTMTRGTLRDYMNTVGFFLDTGGNDKYPLAYPDSLPLFKNNTLWTRPGIIKDPPLATEKGVGYDCEWTP